MDYVILSPYPAHATNPDFFFILQWGDVCGFNVSLHAWDALIAAKYKL